MIQKSLKNNLGEKSVLNNLKNNRGVSPFNQFMVSDKQCTVYCCCLLLYFCDFSSFSTFKSKVKMSMPARASPSLIFTHVSLLGSTWTCFHVVYTPHLALKGLKI